ncbi:MAG: hypothetical protein GY870_08035, partial [archaeon]|nr:hypothetical protein [archaeon]
STEFFNAIKHVKTSERGEYEIQDAIEEAIENNKKVLGVNILPKMKNFKHKNVGAFHITYIKDLLNMNFRLLVNAGLEFEGEYPTSIEPVNSSGKILTGDSVLLGPKVYLGDNCELEDLVEISESILLGNNTIGKRVMIENSIIGPNVKILGAEEVQKFKNCLLLVKTDGKSFEKHDLS